MSLVSKLDVSLEKHATANAEASAEFSASVVKLAERTQMVMFLREALYRLCEQSLNQEFDAGEVLSAYNKAIDTAKAIAEADREKAREAAANAIKGLSPEEIKLLQ